MTYRFFVGAAVLAVAAVLQAGAASAGSPETCVLISGRHVTNHCREKIRFAYCTPSPFTAPSGVVFRPTCNKRSGKNPYYPFTHTLSPGEAYDLPIRDEQRFNFAVCPYGTDLHSDGSGNYSCASR